MKSTCLNSSADELKASFYSLKTREDIANLLELTDYQLRYHLYIFPRDKAYAKFEIKKKSGGVRIISAPITPIKIIQSKLNQVLQTVYEPRLSIHGFTLERSIVTNAQLHIKQRYILNIDIQDFFPSINFGRVRGLFLSRPYSCTSEVATVLAQICCFENQLPQGSPSSPIISNMICAKLDSQLQRLAKANRCMYSRYADDITFSTSRTRFPIQIAKYLLDDDYNNRIILSRELVEVVEGNGFLINDTKVRLQSKYVRQEVTGIIVNEKLNVKRKYIRQIRAMLHAWEKYGLEKAEKEFWRKYDQSHRRSKHPVPFKEVVRGKIEFIGHVRGKGDYLYLKMILWLSRLDPQLISEAKINSLITEYSPIAQNTDLPEPIVWTEGKTDIIHLSAALSFFDKTGSRHHIGLKFKSDLDEGKQGSNELYAALTQLCKVPQVNPMIAIFDRDEPSMTKKIHDESKGFKDWGNGVYSFALPIPKHRNQCSEICIEHYYQDEVIKKESKDGRRLFMSDEFNLKSGRHLSLELVTNDKSKLNSGQLKILDNNVFDKNSENIALSKKDFAAMISEGSTEMDFSAFGAVFEIVKKIQVYFLGGQPSDRT